MHLYFRALEGYRQRGWVCKKGGRPGGKTEERQSGLPHTAEYQRDRRQGFVI